LPFSRKDVPAWMLAPVATIYLPVYRNGQPEHVVIRPVDDDRPAVAIQPTTKRPFDEGKDSILQVGQTRADAALVAEFPLSALKAGREFFMTFRVDRGESRNVQTFSAEIDSDLLTLAGCPVACQ
jgi:hypothetical protein